MLMLHELEQPHQEPTTELKNTSCEVQQDLGPGSPTSHEQLCMIDMLFPVRLFMQQHKVDTRSTEVFELLVLTEKLSRSYRLNVL